MTTLRIALDDDLPALVFQKNTADPSKVIVRGYTSAGFDGAFCRSCGAYTPADSLKTNSSHRHGKKAECRPCSAAESKKWRAANSKRSRDYHRDWRSDTGLTKYQVYSRRLSARTSEQVRLDRERLRPGGVKKCRSCSSQMPLKDFYDDVSKSDGLSDSCIPCSNAARLSRRVRPFIKYWESVGIAVACIYCGGDFRHVDHITPRVLGGSDDYTNLAPSCEKCNLSKNGTPLKEWYPEYTANNNLPYSLGDLVDKLAKIGYEA